MTTEPFVLAHASDDDWQQCAASILRQWSDAGQPSGSGGGARLGFLYVNGPLAEHASDILTLLKVRTGVLDWVGTVGAAVLAGPHEYAGEPGVCAMLATLPRDSFRVFSGLQRSRPPGERTASGARAAHSALVHVDPSLPDVEDMLHDLAGRIDGGRVFGGLSGGGRPPLPQFANRTFAGGLSGVEFSDDVIIRTRVSQGCSPLAAPHRVTACDGRYVLELDDEPALDILLSDLGVARPLRASRDGDELLAAFPAERLRHGLFAGIADAAAPAGFGFGDYRVRNVAGIDPGNRLIALGDAPRTGDRLVFCTRDAQAARTDLIRICTELRDEVEGEGLVVRGGLYVSCAGRGQALFGRPGAEARIIEAQLGPFALAGFLANGEIAGGSLYGHTGVLALFCAPARGAAGAGVSGR